MRAWCTAMLHRRTPMMCWRTTKKRFCTSDQLLARQYSFQFNQLEFEFSTRKRCNHLIYRSAKLLVRCEHLRRNCCATSLAATVSLAIERWRRKYFSVVCADDCAASILAILRTNAKRNSNTIKNNCFPTTVIQV